MAVKIAYLLLCHKNAESVIAQVRALTASGDAVALHFDRKGAPEAFAKLTETFRSHPEVVFAERVSCGWGEYSLVQASLNMLNAARKAFDGATHYQLISGDCYPIKSHAQIRQSLEPGDCDYIEVNDFFDSDWIKTGLREERLIYRHYFNEREQKTRFYWALDLQRRLGLKRKLPEGLRIKIGSQWWLLRASTVERILEFMRKRPEIVRFFKTTWIPDETMFQTIAFHSAPRTEIRSHPPTALIFSDYGMPVVFHNDHEAILKAEPRFFARKITETSPAFRQSLLDRYVDGPADPPGAPPREEMIGRYYSYLASRGREGRRHGDRFWRRASTLDDSKEVLLIAAKKWHVGRRFADTVQRVCGCPALGYVFDDESPLPLDLGGLERGKDKRERHRRAFLGLLFDALGASRIALCIDPSRDDVIRDFAATDCRMRVLTVETPFSDDDYTGHAQRVGLIGRNAAHAQVETIRSALRAQFADENHRLRQVAAGRIAHLRHEQDRREKAAAIAAFLRAGREQIEAVTRDIEPYL